MENSKGIKTILVGETGVGKTNLINVSMGKEFIQNLNSSLTSAYYENEVQYNNKKYLYTLWDTAGQERFRSLNKIFIKDSKVVLIVFAIDNKNSYNEINYWIKYIKDILGEEKYIMGLVANKSDLYEEQVISDEEMINKAKENNMKFKLTSAYSDAEGFKDFLHELLKDYINLIGPQEEKKLSFTLIQEPVGKKKKKKCC